MKNKTKLLIIALLLSGQTVLPSTFDIYTSQHGLSQNTVNAIIQDKHGFLWIATRDGLNFFDGNQFITFNHNPEDSTSLSDNFINTIYEDGPNIWVGTQNGLNQLLYDPIKNKIIFKRSFPTQSDTSRPKSDNITAIFRDSQNDLFIGTTKGLFKTDFDPASNTINTFSKQIFGSEAPEVLSKKYIRNIVEDYKQNLWIAILGHGIVHYNRTTGRFSHFDEILPPPYQLPTGFVTNVFIDSRNWLWAGYYGEGFSLLKLNDFYNGLFAVETFQKPVIADNRVYDFAEGSDSSVWIATFKAGTSQARITDTGLKFTNTDLAKKNNTNELINYVRCLQKDISGNLWLGTNYGLAKTSLFPPKFTHLKKDKNDPKSLSENSVLSILKSKDGKTWIGSDRGLDRLSQSMQKEKHFKLAHNNKIKTIGFIKTLLQDSDGNIWAGTFGGGIFRYGPKNDRFKQVPDPVNSKIDLRTTVLAQTKKGHLWIGTLSGLFGYNIAENIFKKFEGTGLLKNGGINQLFADSEKRLWVATAGTVKILNREEKHFIEIPLSQKSKLKKITVNSFYEDKQNKIWVASNTGLFFYDKKNNRLNRLETTAGNTGQAIMAIRADNKENLWFSSNKGLYRFNKQQSKITQFDFPDGLQGKEYFPNSVATGASGQILFGGYNGLNYFNPGTIKTNKIRPLVNITSVTVFNKNIFNSLQLRFKKNITLHYSDRYLAFEFNSLDFQNPSQKNFAYKLEGFDKNFIYSGQRNYASYTNLYPKTYIFKVIAANKDGFWNKEGDFFTVTILPPWWLTWWASLIYILLFLLFLYVLRLLALRKEKQAGKLKVAQLKLKTAELENKVLNTENEIAQNNIRIRIANDLHDEIGSNLSSIILMSDTTLKSPGLNKNVTQVLLDIYESARMSTESIRDIIWFSNPNSDRFIDLQDRMNHTAKKLLGNTTFNFNRSGDLDNENLSPALKRNLYLVFKETLNNIAKHAHAKYVNISFNKEGNKLTLKISDDGVGFNEGSLHGNGLKSIKNRAKQIGGIAIIKSAQNAGTQVLVELEMDSAAPFRNKNKDV